VKVLKSVAIVLLSLLSIISYIGCVMSIVAFVRGVFPFSLTGVLHGVIWGAICYGSLRLWAWPLRKLGIELSVKGPRRIA
jgi:hypothetical protein